MSGHPRQTVDPEAWPYGPVYPFLWFALKRYGKDQITKSIDADTGLVQPSNTYFNRDEREILGKVYETYGRFHAYQLSAMTHEKGTPWQKIYEKEGKPKEVIATDLIKDHFIELARQRTAS